MEAIVADLDTRRFGYHVAVENWEHDFNIGTVVRNANAFAAAAVHIVGRRRWNRRGAMVTDRYQHVHHHDSVDTFAAFARDAGLADRGDRQHRRERADRVDADCPSGACCCSARRGRDCHPRCRTQSAMICAITQYGSTRSINAGVASGIAMHCWLRLHAP